jgi:hypothetical protein
MTQLAKFGSLRGKRVFITGGGTGIGEAMVISFAEQGAQVAFVDIARDPSLALVRRVKAILNRCSASVTSQTSLRCKPPSLNWLAWSATSTSWSTTPPMTSATKPPKSRKNSGTSASPSTSARCSSPARLSWKA